MSFDHTLAVRGGRRHDPVHGSVLTPIHQTTTFARTDLDGPVPYSYSRQDNPTVSALEEALGALEQTLPAVACSSGMSAIATLCLTVLRAGDHVVLGDPVYGGTVRLAREVLADLGVEITFADAAEPGRIEAAIRPRTRLVLIESPANPTLRLSDIAGTARVCRRRGCLLAVDNTFLTAVGQRPLELGADVSVYSTTKFIEGHNATIGGALVTGDADLRQRLERRRKTLGTIQAPWDAWLTLRGLTTLPLRLEQHSRNALRVATWLEQQPGVAAVHYPGLASFPQRDLARAQQSLDGGLLAVDLDGGIAAGRHLLKNLQLCILAENLGAAETLITHPATMTHADVPAAQRRAAGITDGLVRLSVGLESPDHIIADLARGLACAREVGHA